MGAYVITFTCCECEAVVEDYVVASNFEVRSECCNSPVDIEDERWRPSELVDELN